ncbi:Angio-associated migratory cell protein [Zootermopsis nevadensis]|uniref:Angio-associated migratory cell protein n=1 Tax=Zootermopsis nevadensis TaxID=136037 RepID=A0A067R0M1_ZOONE|nr:Angio-associated migratory cell protein [Zootermopsis nevadensis]
MNYEQLAIMYEPIRLFPSSRNGDIATGFQIVAFLSRPKVSARIVLSDALQEQNGLHGATTQHRREALQVHGGLLGCDAVWTRQPRLPNYKSSWSHNLEVFRGNVLTQLKDTPPTSPCSNETMDYNELFEDEVEEVIDGEAASSNNYIEANDASDEDIGIGLEGSENSEGNNPVRDDSASVFSHHKGSVFCCHLQPKAGRLAVTGAEDDMAYVWETHSGEVVLQCKGHKDSVTCVRFNYDGSYVATGDMSGVIQVWKIANKLQVWETCIGDLTWLRWHHGANVLLAGTESGEVYVWRIPGGECKVLPGHGDKADCGLMLPDGKRMAIGYADGSLKIFDTKTATVLHHVPQGQAHTGTITDMDCHPDNNLLISSSVDGHAVVLKTQTGKKNGLSPLMCLQMTLLSEWFVTYITGKWPFSTVCTLMSLQITLINE